MCGGAQAFEEHTLLWRCDLRSGRAGWAVLDLAERSRLLPAQRYCSGESTAPVISGWTFASENPTAASHKNSRPDATALASCSTWHLRD